MKRVLYIQHTAAIGGCTLTLIRLLEKLDRTLYEPLVLFLENGPGVDMARSLGVTCFIEPRIKYYFHGEGAHFPVRSLRPWLPFTRLLQIYPSALRTRHFLEEHPVDLVHLNSMVLIGSLWGAHMAGIPTLFHVREVLARGVFGFRRKLFQSMTERFADRIIAIAQHNAAQLTPSPKIKVIYDSLDFARFDRHLNGDRIREEFRYEAKQPIVGMLGGTVRHKGLEPFLRAAAIVHQQQSNVRFLVAGKPPRPDLSISLRRRVRHRLEDLLGIPNLNRSVPAYIQSVGLNEAVTFIGTRSDVPDVLAALDILVFPATVSHFALPVIEAGAMAKPVVASDFPSTREIVEHNVTGLLVPPEDPQALAEAVISILVDPDQARSMGETGYQQTRLKFDSHANIPAAFRVYEDLLKHVPEE